MDMIYVYLKKSHKDGNIIEIVILYLIQDDYNIIIYI